MKLSTLLMIQNSKAIKQTRKIYKKKLFKSNKLRMISIKFLKTNILWKEVSVCLLQKYQLHKSSIRSIFISEKLVYMDNCTVVLKITLPDYYSKSLCQSITSNLDFIYHQAESTFKRSWVIKQNLWSTLLLLKFSNQNYLRFCHLQI